MDWHGWGIADALKGLGVSDKVVDDDDGKMLVAWIVRVSTSRTEILWQFPLTLLLS
jgi:hypothetical protein